MNSNCKYHIQIKYNKIKTVESVVWQSKQFFVYLRGGLETLKVLLILEQNCVQHNAYTFISCQHFPIKCYAIIIRAYKIAEGGGSSGQHPREYCKEKGREMYGDAGEDGRNAII